MPDASWVNLLLRETRTFALNAMDILLPAPCAGCGRLGTVLCRACVRHLVQRPQTIELPAFAGRAAQVVAVCSDIAVNIIGQAKDRQLTALLPALERVACHAIDAAMVRAVTPNATPASHSVPWFIVLIPTTPRAWRRRGFVLLETLMNRASMRSWLQARKLIVARDALVWTRPTRDQRTLDKQMRSTNMEAAFSARGIVDRHVVLVDDVVTTGATCAAAHRALIRAGARSVTVAALAAPPSHRNVGKPDVS